MAAQSGVMMKNMKGQSIPSLQALATHALATKDCYRLRKVDINDLYGRYSVGLWEKHIHELWSIIIPILESEVSKYDKDWFIVDDSYPYPQKIVKDILKQMMFVSNISRDHQKYINMLKIFLQEQYQKYIGYHITICANNCIKLDYSCINYNPIQNILGKLNLKFQFGTSYMLNSKGDIVYMRYCLAGSKFDNPDGYPALCDIGSGGMFSYLFESKNYKLEFYAIKDVITNIDGKPAVRAQYTTDGIEKEVHYYAENGLIDKIVSKDFVSKDLVIEVVDDIQFCIAIDKYSILHNRCVDLKINTQYKNYQFTLDGILNPANHIIIGNMWFFQIREELIYVIEFVPGKNIGVMHSPKSYYHYPITGSGIYITKSHQHINDVDKIIYGFDLSKYTKKERRSFIYWFWIRESKRTGHQEDRTWYRNSFKQKDSKAILDFAHANNIVIPA